MRRTGRLEGLLWCGSESPWTVGAGALGPRGPRGPGAERIFLQPQKAPKRCGQCRRSAGAVGWGLSVKRRR